jgi:hypothetical protein
MIRALAPNRSDQACLASAPVRQSGTAEWLARQLTEAFPWNTSPKYLIRIEEINRRNLFPMIAKET